MSKLVLILALVLIIGFGFLVFLNVQAGPEHNLSGYAWSENIGWISFNEGDLVGCPVAPCQAKLDFVTKQVSGWAKALTDGGGWPGWIRLRDTNYGVSWNDSTQEMEGWAWSDQVIGWMSFNCNNPETGNVCLQSNYKVYASFTLNQPPSAAISCDSSQCSGGSCNANWIAFRATANPIPCIYTIKNNSTDVDSTNCPIPCNDDIVRSEWYLKQQGEPESSYVLKLSCVGVCNYTLQPDVAPGIYDVKLYVKDQAGDSDSTTHSLYMRKEIEAGFMCSLDNSNWRVCESLSGFVSQGGLVYFKDNLPDPNEHTSPTEGAIIDSREWRINGAIFDSDNNSTPSINLTEGSNIIRLTVTDSENRNDYQEHSIVATLPFPEWKEVPPF